MATEIELKLLCDQSFSLDIFLTQIKSIATITRQKKGDNNDAYYDTESRCFAGAGLSARLRIKGSKRQLDIKSVPLLPEMIMNREEYSLSLSPRQNPENALKKWAESSWPMKLVGKAKPYVLVKSKRQKFILETSGYKAELSYDESMVLHPGSQTGPTFCEMECEFISGDPGAFMFVCQLISQYSGLAPSKLSKYQRACELLGKPSWVFGAPKVSFNAIEPVDDVARRICLEQFQTMLGYEPGTRVGIDLEHLHKMRVAVRRLRSALSLFHDCFDQRRLRALAEHFQWLADTLGVVRDLDVQQLNQRLWREMLGDSAPEGWLDLESTLKRDRLEGRKKLIEALNGPRYKGLCEKAERLFSSAPRRKAEHPGLEPIAGVGGRAIQKRTVQFRKRVKDVRRLGTADALHELRLLGKKLRYTTEFFRPLLSGDIRKKISHLSDFQEQLGKFNDNCVAEILAARLRDEALVECPGNGPYLYVLGQLYGAMHVASKTAQTECEQALEALGGISLTKALEQSASKLQRSLKKKLSKAAAKKSQGASAAE
jgi:CHAD domain-containing protein